MITRPLAWPRRTRADATSLMDCGAAPLWWSAAQIAEAEVAAEGHRSLELLALVLAVLLPASIVASAGELVRGGCSGIAHVEFADEELDPCHIALIEAGSRSSTTNLPPSPTWSPRRLWQPGGLASGTTSCHRVVHHMLRDHVLEAEALATVATDTTSMLPRQPGDAADGQLRPLGQQLRCSMAAQGRQHNACRCQLHQVKANTAHQRCQQSCRRCPPAPLPACPCPCHMAHHSLPGAVMLATWARVRRRNEPSRSRRRCTAAQRAVMLALPSARPRKEPSRSRGLVHSAMSHGARTAPWRASSLAAATMLARRRAGRLV